MFLKTSTLGESDKGLNDGPLLNITKDIKIQLNVLLCTKLEIIKSGLGLLFHLALVQRHALSDAAMRQSGPTVNTDPQLRVLRKDVCLPVYWGSMNIKIISNWST